MNTPPAIDDEAGVGQVMSPNAVSLLSLSTRPASTAPHVLRMANRFQMIGAYATRIAAQVVQLKVLIDWAIGKFVGETMGVNDATRRDMELSVASPRKARRPQPTVISFLDLEPKAFKWGDRDPASFHSYSVPALGLAGKG